MAKTNTAIDTEDNQEGGDAPLIDLNEASLKKLISRAKKRGVITVDELNAVVGDMTTDQIEDVMSAFWERGTNVVKKEGGEKEKTADTDAGLDDSDSGEGERYV